jgi:hypothetical protein
MGEAGLSDAGGSHALVFDGSCLVVRLTSIDVAFQARPRVPARRTLSTNTPGCRAVAA